MHSNIFFHSYSDCAYPRYREVTEWEPVSDADILNAYEEIYDHYLPEERSQIQPEDLYNLDLDRDGFENNIYDSDGYRIPRRIPLHDPDSEPCGLLADLGTIRDLFRPPAEDEDDDDSVVNLDEDRDPLQVNVYPQAFTRQFGHFQANQVPAGFQPVLQSLNERLLAYPDEHQSAIQGVACQGYNHLQHCLTERAGGLDVVQGQMTAALTGVGAQGPKATRAYEKVINSLHMGLPHQRVQRKLARRDVLSRAFRLEPVFVVNVQALQPRYQSGS